jgi:putative glutamine amidotransferase
MHHQGIKDLGEGLLPTARAPDGLVEAVEVGGDHFMIGVQWHPEALIESDLGTRRLFSAFIEASREFRYSHALAG